MASENLNSHIHKKKLCFGQLCKVSKTLNNYLTHESCSFFGPNLPRLGLWQPCTEIYCYTHMM